MPMTIVLGEVMPSGVCLIGGRGVTGEQRRAPSEASYSPSLKFMGCPVVSRTGNKDSLVFMKGLGPG